MLAKMEAAVDGLLHHVMLTEPGAEFKAAKHLRSRGFDPYVPTEKATTFRNIKTMFGTYRRDRLVTRPIFRGYLILPLNMAWSFGPIHTTPGLRDRPFLMICGKPAVLTGADVAKLKGAEEHLKDAPIQGLPYKIGDQVRIVQGPFAGLAAQIARLDDAARIELLMDMLGGRVKAHVTASQIELHD